MDLNNHLQSLKKLNKLPSILNFAFKKVDELETENEEMKTSIHNKNNKMRQIVEALSESPNKAFSISIGDEKSEFNSLLRKFK